MYNGKRIVGIIPARGGSKGIPHKNIAVLGGKPLIAYTIEAAKTSEYLDRCIVSTDSEVIRELACRWGADIPFMRPEEIAQDTTESIEVVIHVLNWFEKNGEQYDYVILLQPTSPLRSGEHIDKAIEKIIDSQAESLVSLTEVSENPIHMRYLENGKLIKIVDYKGRSRRQDYPAFYKINGAIYINTVEMLLKKRVFVDDDTRPFMMNKLCSIDIDSQDDLETAERYMQILKDRNE